jgi:lysophospholipase L1-like esterase
MVDFAPMPRRKTGALSATMSKVSAAVQRIEAQREPHAEFWDAWNRAAVVADGPLWVALGDSTSQGIGAVDPRDGWIPRVRDRLRSSTGDPWRIINLSMTGAQFSDIANVQLSRLSELVSAGHSATLTTHLAGANNLMAPNTWPTALRDLNTILDALPEHSVVARVGVSSPFNSLLARGFTRAIERAGEEKAFQLFWPWDWPSRDGMGEDKWHPGPKGYGYMADAIFDKIAASLAAR